MHHQAASDTHISYAYVEFLSDLVCVTCVGVMYPRHVHRGSARGAPGAHLSKLSIPLGRFRISLHSTVCKLGAS